MSYVSDKIQNLIRQLLPNGRAFWARRFGWFDALNISTGGDGTNSIGTLERAYNDAASIPSHVLPGNENFTDGTANPSDNDCNDQERIFGLIQYGVTGPTTPSREDRMKAIAVAMAYPGSDRPRQAAGYLETQLRAAGFDVRVYENIFMPGGVPKTPEEILGIIPGGSEYDDFEYGGESEYGASYNNIIANYIDEAKDSTFIVSLRSSFFIAGATIDTFADVQLVRKAEFRQMILKLKPEHEAGFLFVNYV